MPVPIALARWLLPFAVVLAAAAVASHMLAATLTADVVDLRYRSFDLQFSCERRSALRFSYRLSVDGGDHSRPSFFTMDPRLDQRCQQRSLKSYQQVHHDYDRGHLVMSNHMDDSRQAIQEANYMTNIVPQASVFNRGIWLQTEQITECYRDLAPITIYGGVVYTDDRSSDFFVASHGIRTPSFFWKVLETVDVRTGANSTIAWYIPNQPHLQPLHSYVVSVDYIESQLTDQLGPIPSYPSMKAFVASEQWKLPADCVLS